MYDPMTVAFTIPRPWPYRSNFNRKDWFWPPMVTIWHVDPERGGSDDSCGWSRPPLSDTDRKIIDDLVDWESKHPYFASPSIPASAVVIDPNYDYPQMTPGDSLALTACAWQMIAKEKAHRTGRDHGGWRRVSKLTMREWVEIVQVATYPHDNLRSLLVSTHEEPPERVRRFFLCVMNAYNRFHRPWYRHPRWHLWHWKIQIHPLQTFKRWAFSRCCKCGKGFKWGYSPTTYSWNGTGPRWFRSEPDVFHSDCDRPNSSGACMVEDAAERGGGEG